uniref:Uncharacterized protein n=1 Tax=Leersia perrieri TaxID=77586 RepID=A0A0D9XVD5_9ORYZ
MASKEALPAVGCVSLNQSTEDTSVDQPDAQTSGVMSSASCKHASSKSLPKIKISMEGSMFNLPARLDRLLRHHGNILPKGADEEIPLIKRDLE